MNLADDNGLKLLEKISSKYSYIDKFRISDKIGCEIFPGGLNISPDMLTGILVQQST